MSVSEIEEGKTYWVQGTDKSCQRLTAVRILHAGDPSGCHPDELCLIETGPLPYLGGSVACGPIDTLVPSGELSYGGHRVFANQEDVVKLLRQSEELRQQADAIESM